jgi:hypothetical protein
MKLFRYHKLALIRGARERTYREGSVALSVVALRAPTLILWEPFLSSRWPLLFSVR